MPGNNFKNIEYAPWLEQTLRELIRFPVTGICMFAVDEDGTIYNNYHNVSTGDKIKIAGYIQQDAMLETLRTNNIIQSERDETEKE